jgi:hypothetical protein
VAESRDDTKRRFDWLGALVAALAVGGLSFGVHPRRRAMSGRIRSAWASIAIGLTALIAFPFLMARRRDPLVPLGLFRSRAFTTINLMTSSSGAGSTSCSAT